MPVLFSTIFFDVYPYEPSPGRNRGVFTPPWDYEYIGGNLLVFGSISLSHLSQSAAPARARISVTAPLLRKGSHQSLLTGSTASIAVDGQHSVTTHSS